MIKTLQDKTQERTGNVIGQQFVVEANRGLDVEEKKNVQIDLAVGWTKPSSTIILKNDKQVITDKIDIY